MDVLVENTSSLGRRIKVSVPDAVIKEQVRDKMAKLSRDIKLKGFRPGKVPFNVVQKKFGSSVRMEVIQNIVQTTLDEAFKENDLVVAGRPSIESLEAPENQNLEFVATFEVYPQITLNPFSDLAIQKRVVEVTDQDVEKMQTKLQEQWGEDGKPLTLEALAEKLRIEGGVDNVKTALHTRLEQEANGQLREEVKEKVLEQLLEHNRFELPEALLQQEREAIQREIARDSQGAAPENTEEQTLEIEEAARKRVELGLLLNEVIKKYQLTPDMKKVQEQVLRMAFSYAKPAEVIEAYQKNRQLRFSVERMVLLEQAVDAILGEMKVTEEKVSFDTVMNQEETA